MKFRQTLYPTHPLWAPKALPCSKETFSSINQETACSLSAGRLLNGSNTQLAFATVALAPAGGRSTRLQQYPCAVTADASTICRSQAPLFTV